MTRRTHDVRAPEGRTLRVHEEGDPHGPAILVHHGTPDDGSLFGPWVEDATRRGVRLLGYDRPGYGGSSPRPGRRVADAADDARVIADTLGLDRFATWGVSGGGPHALACAALLPDRVVAAASVAGVAPFDAEGLNVLAGMGRDNLVEFGAALMGRETLRPLAEAHAEAMLAATPREIAQSIRSLIAPVDDLALDRGFADFWAEAMPRVFAQGVEGWLDDDEAFVEPFGFDVAAITRPVLVWHGHHDRFVPPSHGRWLGARIPGAEVRLTADDGHLTLSVDRIPAVHEWLLARF